MSKEGAETLQVVKRSLPTRSKTKAQLSVLRADCAYVCSQRFSQLLDVMLGIISILPTMDLSMVVQTSVSLLAYQGCGNAAWYYLNCR